MDLTTLTEEELDALRVQVLTEQERRRAISEAPALMDQVADRYASAVEDGTPTPWAELTDKVGPGQRVIWTDGNTYRNISKAFLPISVTPDQAQWWSQETGLPVEIEAWAPGQSVSIGDLRTYNGVTYSCIQAHTTQAGWTPPAVPALWAPQG